MTKAWETCVYSVSVAGLLVTLRHTYTSLLIMRGENLVYIKEQLGHFSIKMIVDLYGHLIPGIHRGAVDALAEATNATSVQPEGEKTADGIARRRGSLI